MSEDKNNLRILDPNNYFIGEISGNNKKELEGIDENQKKQVSESLLEQIKKQLIPYAPNENNEIIGFDHGQLNFVSSGVTNLIKLKAKEQLIQLKNYMINNNKLKHLGAVRSAMNIIDYLKEEDAIQTILDVYDNGMKKKSLFKEYFDFESVIGRSLFKEVMINPEKASNAYEIMLTKSKESLESFLTMIPSMLMIKPEEAIKELNKKSKTEEFHQELLSRFSVFYDQETNDTIKDYLMKMLDYNLSLKEGSNNVYNNIHLAIELKCTGLEDRLVKHIINRKDEVKSRIERNSPLFKEIDKINKEIDNIKFKYDLIEKDIKESSEESPEFLNGLEKSKEILEEDLYTKRHLIDEVYKKFKNPNNVIYNYEQVIGFLKDLNYSKENKELEKTLTDLIKIINEERMIESFREAPSVLARISQGSDNYNVIIDYLNKMPKRPDEQKVSLWNNFYNDGIVSMLDSALILARKDDKLLNNFITEYTGLMFDCLSVYAEWGRKNEGVKLINNFIDSIKESNEKKELINNFSKEIYNKLLQEKNNYKLNKSTFINKIGLKEVFESAGYVDKLFKIGEETGDSYYLNFDKETEKERFYELFN